MRQAFGLSERSACRALGVARATHRYRSRRPPSTGLIAKLRKLAAERPRFSHRCLHILLRRQGVVVNHKRVYRLYREEGLAVRIKRRRRLAASPRTVPPLPTRPRQRWSMDFVSDRTSNRLRFRVLTLVDDFTTRQQLDYDAFGNVIADSSQGFQPFASPAGSTTPIPNQTSNFGSKDERCEFLHYRQQSQTNADIEVVAIGGGTFRTSRAPTTGLERSALDGGTSERVDSRRESAAHSGAGLAKVGQNGPRCSKLAANRSAITAALIAALSGWSATGESVQLRRSLLSILSALERGNS
jgi:YD repeat-containing protein